MKHSQSRNVLVLTYTFGKTLLKSAAKGRTLLGKRSDCRKKLFSVRGVGNQSETFRNLSELPITETELKLIAALAIMGFSSNPHRG
jgi:hypothetical protein